METMTEYLFTAISGIDGERAYGWVAAKCYDEAISILSQYYTDIEIEIWM